MKKTIIALSLVIALLLVALYKVDLRRRQLNAILINAEFGALIDSIAYSYGPLKFIGESDQQKAEDFLCGHLEDSLLIYREFLDQHPEIRGRNMKMAENAQTLLDKRKSTEHQKD